MSVGILDKALGRYVSNWVRRKAMLRTIDDVRMVVTYKRRVEAAKAIDSYVLPPVEELNARCKESAESIGCDSVFLTIITDKEQTIKAGYNMPDGVETGSRSGLEYSMCVFVVGHEEPIIARNTKHHPELRYCLTVGFVKAYMGTPVYYDGNVIGSLGAIHSETFNFSQGHLSTLQSSARWIESYITPAP